MHQIDVPGTLSIHLKRRAVDADEQDLESRLWEKTLERASWQPVDPTIRMVRVCDRGADIVEA